MAILRHGGGGGSGAAFAMQLLEQLGAPCPDFRTWEGVPCILFFMTERLVRYQHCGDMHFLTFSCYLRLPYFATPESRNLFEDALERIRKKNKFVVAGYVVMPEHVHLLVNEPARSRP
jgi:hypothetical protein